MRARLASLAAAPAVRVLAVGGGLWLAIFAYCDYFLWRDPHGAYFHSDRVYDLDYSSVRREEARGFLQKWARQEPSTTDPSSHAGASPLLCAVFVTIRRSHPEAARYLSDAVGSSLEGLGAKERAALNVSVLFADAVDPTLNTDFGAPWLAAVDHAAGYEGVSTEDLAELKRLEAAQDFQRKGVLDYTYALEKCHRETRAPFIAVFEDDIIFAADWFARTLLGLQHLALGSHPQRGRARNSTQANAHHLPPWLYLRLFYSETFLLWDHGDWAYSHLPTTLVLVSMTSATVLVLLRLLLRLRSGSGGGNLGTRLDVPTMAVLSLLVMPSFTALVFMAGKYNLPMFSLRSNIGDPVGRLLRLGGPGRAGVVAMDRQGCCSQALVFDRAHVPGLIDGLRVRGRGQTDLMIEEYCDEMRLGRFALGEQAVQHVGTITSRGSPNVNAQSVWAFYFEQNKGEDLRRSRRAALDSIDWSFLEALQGKDA